jgi:hypothetical protein
LSFFAQKCEPCPVLNKKLSINKENCDLDHLFFLSLIRHCVQLKEKRKK